MAKDFVEYLKEIVGSITNSKSTDSSTYEDGRKKLEEYLNSASQNVEKQALPETATYEKISYTGKSDEEIEKQVKEELAGYYNTSVSAIENEIAALEKKYNSDKVAAEKNAQSNIEGTQKAYDEAKENLSNDSLKRGLARSSIAVNKQAEVEKMRADTIGKINEDLAMSISELDGEISSLSVKREKALNDFNIAYASKLTTEINKLKTEREEKALEALKYNNTLAEKEFDDKITLASKASELEAEYLKRLDSAQNAANTNYANNYEQMRTLLASLEAAEAKAVLQNDSIFKDNLSDYYYIKLYNEFAR